NVYSSDGSLLATSIPKYDIRFDALTPSSKTFEANLKSLSDSLSEYSGKSSSYYQNEIRKARANKNRYFLIARNINYTDYTRIRNFPLLNLGAFKGGLIVEQTTKRGDYEVIKKKAQEVFYDPAVATKDIVDEVYATVNDRNKLIKTLAIAKSAIRHNMAKDLPKLTVPTCIIWGKNDNVTPPDVAIEFDQLLPDSELFWIDKCGHAAMMEHPQEFNEILDAWLTKRQF
uniref:alpha/beta fold hydrolase n=1 Tax=Gelidibacter sp. TaxID=2018083 RepID=UPI004049202F